MKKILLSKCLNCLGKGIIYGLNKRYIGNCARCHGKGIVLNQCNWGTGK